MLTDFTQKQLPSVEQPETPSSSSGRKLQSVVEEPDAFIDKDDYLFLLNFSIFKDIISALRCPICAGEIHMTDKLSVRMGLAHSFDFICSTCEWKKSFFSSKQCSRVNNKKGRQIFELNARAVISF